VISGASAIIAAGIPSSASDNPIRAPICASRETSSQAVARLTAAAATNMTADQTSRLTRVESIVEIEQQGDIGSAHRLGTSHG
jgi:hypothetical protein